MHQFIFLKHFSSIVEADLAKNLLAQHSLQSVTGNNGVKFPGDMGDSYGADLLVLDTQAAEAKDIFDMMSDKEKAQIVKE